MSEQIIDTNILYDWTNIDNGLARWITLPSPLSSNFDICSFQFRYK